MRGDRSFNGVFTCVLMVLLYFKESKEKKTKQIMKREEYRENKDRNTEEKVFMILILFLNKVKMKENSWLLTTNGSTNMLTS